MENLLQRVHFIFFSIKCPDQTTCNYTQRSKLIGLINTDIHNNM